MAKQSNANCIHTECPECAGDLYVCQVTFVAGGRTMSCWSPLMPDGFETPTNPDAEDCSTDDEVVECRGCRRRWLLASDDDGVLGVRGKDELPPAEARTTRLVLDLTGTATDMAAKLLEVIYLPEAASTDLLELIRQAAADAAADGEFRELETDTLELASAEDIPEPYLRDHGIWSIRDPQNYAVYSGNEPLCDIPDDNTAPTGPRAE